MKKMVSLILTASLLLSGGAVPYASFADSAPNTAESAKEAAEESGLSGDADSREMSLTDKVLSYFSGKLSDLTGSAHDLADTASSATKGASGRAQKMAEEALDSLGNAEKMAEEARNSLSDAEKKADETLTSLFDAAASVMDQAGNAVSDAMRNAEEAKEAVLKASGVIRASAEKIGLIARWVVSKIDLSDEEQIRTARSAVLSAADMAYKRGMFGDTLPRKTLRTIVEVAFGIALNSARYVKGQIDLTELFLLASDLLIREGLPAGAEYLGDRIPIPGAGRAAKEFTEFLIGKILGEPGDAPETDEPAGTAPETDEPAGTAPETDESTGTAPEIDESIGTAPETDESAGTAPETDGTLSTASEDIAA